MFVSAHLRVNADDYHYFLAGKTVDEYCGEEIDSIDREIDEIGTSGLYSVLLEPAGIGLEVYNLHTNPGHDVDLARQHDPDPKLVGGNFTPLNPPVIRLLFRPYVDLLCLLFHLCSIDLQRASTHYDIVYKKPASNDIITAMAYNITTDVPIAHGQFPPQYSFQPAPQTDTDLARAFSFLDPISGNADATGHNSRISRIMNSTHSSHMLGEMFEDTFANRAAVPPPPCASADAVCFPPLMHNPLRDCKPSPSLGDSTGCRARLIDGRASPPRTGLFDEYKPNNHHNAGFQPEMYRSPEDHAQAEKQKKRAKERDKTVKTARVSKTGKIDRMRMVVPRRTAIKS